MEQKKTAKEMTNDVNVISIYSEMKNICAHTHTQDKIMTFSW